MIMMGAGRKQMINHILGPEEGEEKAPSDLHSCMQEFLSAVHNHDVEAAASAFKACFAHLESEPHEEYGDE